MSFVMSVTPAEQILQPQLDVPSFRVVAPSTNDDPVYIDYRTGMLFSSVDGRLLDATGPDSSIGAGLEVAPGGYVDLDGPVDNWAISGSSGDTVTIVPKRGCCNECSAAADNLSRQHDQNAGRQCGRG